MTTELVKNWRCKARWTFYNPPMKFELAKTDNKARLGKMTFARGEINTPAFMPVGTYGTVKAMTVEEVKELGA